MINKYLRGEIRPFLWVCGCVWMCAAHAAAATNAVYHVDGAMVTNIWVDGTTYAAADSISSPGRIGTLGGTVVFSGSDAHVVSSSNTTAQTVLTQGVHQLTTGYQLDGATSDLIITQQATTASGLISSQWGITGIPLSYSITGPFLGGLKYDENSTVRSWDYPSHWQSQFVVVEGENRGLLVWAQDPDAGFKTINIVKDATSWTLTFDTKTVAPYTNNTFLQTPLWRITPYEGDWRDAVTICRQWAEASFSYDAVLTNRPAWCDDIRLVVNCPWPNNDSATWLAPLATKCDPSQTLLYLTNYRLAAFDTGLPDYTPHAGLSNFVAEAHGLGFKVMAHTTPLGCDTNDAVWSQFEPYSLRDPITGDPIGYVNPEDGQFKFRVVHAGSDAWADLYVARMKGLCESNNIDALHLDAFGPSDGYCTGTVEFTTQEGVTNILGKLRAELPDVALGTELTLDFDAHYFDFVQWLAPGMGFGAWSEEYIYSSHPIAAYYFLPYTKPYWHMRIPNAGQFFGAFRNCYLPYGMLPLWRPGLLANIENPNAWMQQMLDEVHFFQARQVDPDLDGAWAANTLFPFKTLDGVSVLRQRDLGEKGDILKAFDAPESIVSRTVRGVQSVACPATVVGAPSYSQTNVFGLNPDTWYVAFDDQPRDTNALHITTLPQGTNTYVDSVMSVDGAIQFRIMRFSGSGSERENFHVFTTNSPALYSKRDSFIIMPDQGDEYEVTTVLSNEFCGLSPEPAGIAIPTLLTTRPFDYLFDTPLYSERIIGKTSLYGIPVVEASAVGGVAKMSIFAHPPSADGKTLVFFPMTLPESPMAKLSVSAGIKDGSASSGVRFSIAVNGQEKTSQTIVPGSWIPMEVDLSQWAGKSILLALVTDADGSVGSDWSAWGFPVVIQL